MDFICVKNVTTWTPVRILNTDLDPGGKLVPDPGSNLNLSQ
jgi:hypothetical protein